MTFISLAEDSLYARPAITSSTTGGGLEIDTKHLYGPTGRFLAELNYSTRAAPLVNSAFAKPPPQSLSKFLQPENSGPQNSSSSQAPVYQIVSATRDLVGRRTIHSESVSDKTGLAIFFVAVDWAWESSPEQRRAGERNGAVADSPSARKETSHRENFL